MTLFRFLLGLMCTAALTAQAQSPTMAPAGGPDTKFRYESAFADYQPYVEVEVISWQRANGDAAMLGGHLGQTKPGPLPATLAPKESSTPMRPHAPASPTPAGHPGHPR